MSLVYSGTTHVFYHTHILKPAHHGPIPCGRNPEMALERAYDYALDMRSPMMILVYDGERALDHHRLQIREQQKRNPLDTFDDSQGELEEFIKEYIHPRQRATVLDRLQRYRKTLKQRFKEKPPSLP
jgi:hypothetical protein